MPKLRPIEKLKQLDFITASEIALLNKSRYGTIKFYSQIGILPYKQEERRLYKRFPREETAKRLQYIRSLKAKGKKIPEIIAIMKNKTF